MSRRCCKAVSCLPWLRLVWAWGSDHEGLTGLLYSGCMVVHSCEPDADIQLNPL